MLSPAAPSRYHTGKFAHLWRRRGGEAVRESHLKVVSGVLIANSVAHCKDSMVGVRPGGVCCPDCGRMRYRLTGAGGACWAPVVLSAPERAELVDDDGEG